MVMRDVEDEENETTAITPAEGEEEFEPGLNLIGVSDYLKNWINSGDESPLFEMIKID
jgi:hypothetical protein